SQIILFYTQQTTHNHASKLESPSWRLFRARTLFRPPHLRRQGQVPLLLHEKGGGDVVEELYPPRAFPAMVREGPAIHDRPEQRWWKEQLSNAHNPFCCHARLSTSKQHVSNV
ncbi:hypothetical protein V5799_021704, partial [Amblyomma americanum]